jgi:hypothetical protein
MQGAQFHSDLRHKCTQMIPKEHSKRATTSEVVSTSDVGAKLDSKHHPTGKNT